MLVDQYQFNSASILGVPLNEVVWLIHAYAMSKDNLALQRELERVRILYNLSKEYGSQT